jgi:DNA-binding NarL/FixJ family response regulator
VRFYSIDGFADRGGVLRDNGPKIPFGKLEKKTKILVIDDDVQVRYLLELFLDPARYAVRSAGGVEEGLTSASRWQPEVVLLDLHLTENGADEGIECLKILRESGCGAFIYVLSGDDSMGQVQRAAKYGAHGYFVKGRVDKFWQRLVGMIGPEGSLRGQYRMLSRAAAGHLETRGLSEWDLALLDLFMDRCPGEKELARRSGRSILGVRKNFQRIRERLGVKTQAQLAYLLGILECFGEAAPRGRVVSTEKPLVP